MMKMKWSLYKKFVGIIVMLAIVVTSLPIQNIKAEDNYNYDQVGNYIEAIHTDQYKEGDSKLMYQITKDAGNGAGEVKTIASYDFSQSETSSVSVPAIISYQKKQYTVTEIGENSFSYSFSKEVNLPDTIKVIGSGAFSSSSIESIDLPNNLISIGDYAFQYSRLQKITFPDNLLDLGIGVFNFTQITDVFIPAKVKTLYETFTRCTELKSIKVDKNNPYFKSVNNMILSKNGDTLYTSAHKSIISVPEGVKIIKKQAFENCYNYYKDGNTSFDLLKLTLPSSIKTCEFNGNYIRLIKFKGKTPPTLEGSLYKYSNLLVDKKSLSKYKKSKFGKCVIITKIPYLSSNKKFLKKMLDKNGKLLKSLKTKGLKKPKDISSADYTKIKTYTSGLVSGISDEYTKARTLFLDILRKKSYNYDAWEIVGSFSNGIYVGYKDSYNVKKYNSTYPAFIGSSCVGEGFSNLTNAYMRCEYFPSLTVLSEPGKSMYPTKQLNILYLDKKLRILDPSDTSRYYLYQGEINSSSKNTYSYFDQDLEVFSLNNKLTKIL